MAYVQKDRVQETSTTTGTGAFTLAGAVDRFRTFASVCSTGDVFEYFIQGASGTGEWETGLGTYSGTNTLTRTTVVESSNANAAVNFSAGSKQVGIAPLSSRYNRSLFPINPPTTSLFTLSNDASGTTATVNTTSKIYNISRTDTGTATTDKMLFRGKAYPAGSNWDADLYFFRPPPGETGLYSRTGLTVLENATGKSLSLVYDTNNGTPRYILFSMTGLATFGTAIANTGTFKNRDSVYFRVHDGGTTLQFYYSRSFGASWETIGSALTKTTYFTTAPDRIGVCAQSYTTFSAGDVAVPVFLYSDPDFPVTIWNS